MYPKNASSPPPIAVGAIYSTVDGSLVTTGASVRVKTGTGSWAAGANSPVCDTTSGTWVYTPSQGETNAASFMVAIYAASATQAVVTVVTTVSDTAGYAGLDWGVVRQATATLALTGTTISSTQAVASVSGAVGSISGVTFPANFSALAITVGGAVTAGTVSDKTGYSLTQAFPANFSTLGITSSGYISRVVLVDTTTANSDMRGTDNAALATYWTQQRAGYLDSVLIAANSNRTVQVTGSQHIAADVHETQSGSIHTATFDTGAITAAVLAADAITAAKVAADVGEEIATAVRTELTTELGRIDATVSSRSTLTATAAADAVLGRGVGNVETTADDYSLTTLVLAALESSVSGSTWTIKQTDGTTTHLTRSITTDANANPITAVA
jgi:hypothetical protein